MSQKYPFLCFLTLPWPWWPQRIWCIIQGFKKAKNESNFLKEFTHSIIIISPMCSPPLSTNKCKNGKTKKKYPVTIHHRWSTSSFFSNKKKRLLISRSTQKTDLKAASIMYYYYNNSLDKFTLKKLPSNHKKSSPKCFNISLQSLLFF